MDYPIYRGLITDNDNDDFEVNYIAMVNKPAIRSNFLAFSEDKAAPLKYAITNEEERIVTGLAMVANMPLYRDQDGEKFFVFYTAEDIKQIALRFFRKKYNYNFNLDHDPKKTTNDIYIFESWIVERAKGKVPPTGFEDAEEGSWLISAKVDNPKIWDDILNGNFQGFSVQGFFKLRPVAVASDTPEEDISEEEFKEQLSELLQHSA